MKPLNSSALFQVHYSLPSAPSPLLVVDEDSSSSPTLMLETAKGSVCDNANRRGGGAGDGRGRWGSVPQSPLPPPPPPPRSSGTAKASPPSGLHPLLVLSSMLFVGFFIIGSQLGISFPMFSSVSGGAIDADALDGEEGAVVKVRAIAGPVGSSLTSPSSNAPPPHMTNGIFTAAPTADAAPHDSGDDRDAAVVSDIPGSHAPRSEEGHAALMIADLLTCHIYGHDHETGANRLFMPLQRGGADHSGTEGVYGQRLHGGGGRCVPFPRPALGVAAHTANADAGDGAWGTYTRPLDPTLIPSAVAIAAEEDRRTGGAGATFILNGTATGTADNSSSIALRSTPSVYSRWLYDEWRLWEGELRGGEGCGGAQQHPQGLEESTDTPQANSGPAPFATKGFHNASTPSTLYQLDYFCVDALEGSLVEFVGDAADGKGPSHIEDNMGRTDTYYDDPFPGTVRFLRENNRRVVPLVPEGGRGGTVSSSWRKVVEDALVADHRGASGAHRRHHRPDGEGSSTITSPYRYPLPPRVLFVDDPVLIVPQSAENAANPYHQYERMASSAAQARLVGAKSYLFLMELVAQTPWMRGEGAYRKSDGPPTAAWHVPPRGAITNRGVSGVGPYWSRQYRRAMRQRHGSGDSADPPLDLLPRYLLTSEELNAMGPNANGTDYDDRKGIASDLNSIPSAGFGVPSLPFTSFVRYGKGPSSRSPAAIGRRVEYLVPDPPTMAAAEFVGSNHMRFNAYAGVYVPMLSSGEEGCDAWRCGSGSVVESPPLEPRRQEEQCAVHRRCARPWAALPIAQTILDRLRVEGGPPHTSDGPTTPADPTREEYLFSYETFNYSRLVWMAASTATMLEGRRLRREVWEGVVAGRASSPSAPSPSASRGKEVKTYIGLWRDRLVSFIIDARTARQQNGTSGGVGAADDHTVERAVAAYLNDYFGYHLEKAYVEENMKAGGGGKAHQGYAGPAILPERQELMCYRKGYISHVYYKNRPRIHTERGSIGLALPANCHTREAVMMSYQSAWAAYGQCAVGGSTNQSSSSPLRNPNHDAHPLFALPRAERAGLQEAFGRSRRLIDAALADALRTLQQQQPPTSVGSGGGGTTATTADPSLALLDDPSFLAPLLGRIDEAMMGYDKLLMAYLRTPTAEETSDVPRGAQRGAARHGRRIRLYVPFRTKQRPVLHLRPQLSKLMLEGLGDYVSLTLDEGVADSVYSTASDEVIELLTAHLDLYTNASQHQVKNMSSSLRPIIPKASPRAAQMGAVMRTDLYFGPHGADLHRIAYVKPSAFVTELCPQHIDNDAHFYEGGFFAGLAFSRQIGYIKMPIHTVFAAVHPPSETQRNHTWNATSSATDAGGSSSRGAIGEAVGDGARHRDAIRRSEVASVLRSYLTLPELRNALSVTVCGWLATNAMRLADKGGGGGGGATTKAETDHMVPWWCRGGPVGVVHEFIKAVRTSKGSAAVVGVGSEKEDANGMRNLGAQRASDGAPSSNPSEEERLRMLVAAARRHSMRLAKKPWERAPSPLLVGDYYHSRAVHSGFGPFVALGRCTSLRQELFWGASSSALSNANDRGGGIGSGGRVSSRDTTASANALIAADDALRLLAGLFSHSNASSGSGSPTSHRLLPAWVAVGRTGITRALMDAFQNTCCLEVTKGATANNFNPSLHVNSTRPKETYMFSMRRRAEGLQTLLETAVLMPSGLASYLGRVMTQGHGVVADYEGRRLEREVYPRWDEAVDTTNGTDPVSSSSNSGFVCGADALFDESLYTAKLHAVADPALNPAMRARWDCLAAMLRLALGPTRERGSGMADRGNAIARPARDAIVESLSSSIAASRTGASGYDSASSPPFASAFRSNATLLSIAIDYICYHYFDVFARPTSLVKEPWAQHETVVMTRLGTYGYDCTRHNPPPAKAPL